MHRIYSLYSVSKNIQNVVKSCYIWIHLIVYISSISVLKKKVKHSNISIIKWYFHFFFQICFFLYEQSQPLGSRGTRYLTKKNHFKVGF